VLVPAAVLLFHHHRPPHAMSSSSLAEVDSLLDNLVTTIHAQLQQEKILDSCIREQVQIAHHLQHVQGNQLGVVFQMRKVHEMQTVRQRRNLAIQLLQDHVESIESQLEQEQAQAQLANPHNDDHTDAKTYRVQAITRFDLFAQD
jgi:hypothetical protein